MWVFVYIESRNNSQTNVFAFEKETGVNFWTSVEMVYFSFDFAAMKGIVFAQWFHNMA